MSAPLPAFVELYTPTLATLAAVEPARAHLPPALRPAALAPPCAEGEEPPADVDRAETDLEAFLAMSAPDGGWAPPPDPAADDRRPG